MAIFYFRFLKSNPVEIDPASSSAFRCWALLPTPMIERSELIGSVRREEERRVLCCVVFEVVPLVSVAMKDSMQETMKLLA